MAEDAPILILDEPTAALDTLAERAVFAALDQLRMRRTTFVIANRVSSVRDADRILVLDRVHIVAQGRHQELLESCDRYRRLCAQLADADADGSERVEPYSRLRTSWLEPWSASSEVRFLVCG